MRKVIKIFNENQKNTANYLDAESLAKSWGDIFINFEVSQDINDQFSEFTYRTSPQNASSELIKLLDSVKNSEELLILPLCMKDEVAGYIASKEKKDTRILNWHIVYNNFVRYSFLESNRNLATNIPQDTNLWIQQLIKKYSKKIILESLNSLSKKIHLLGESIIDEYIYCEALGKVSKDPLIAFRISEKVQQFGGILAAAKHVEKLTGGCVLFSEIDSASLESLTPRISENIDTHLVTSERTSQVTKTRYVDISSNVRVFETYSMNTNYSSENEFTEMITKYFKENYVQELFIIDFGHGLINSEIIDLLMTSNVKISVNTQSNAGNRGFNSISKYTGAERIFINGVELELEARRKTINREELILEIAPRLKCKEMFVTQGAAGLLFWNESDGVMSVPGFAPSIVDRVGAGDVLLTTVSALRANGVPIDIACFYGNISGGIAVGSIGNSFSISKSILLSNAIEILDRVDNISE